MKTEKQPEPGTKPKPRRRPYTPPAILSREPLEAVAAVCIGPGAKANLACGRLRS